MRCCHPFHIQEYIFGRGTRALPNAEQLLTTITITTSSAVPPSLSTYSVIILSVLSILLLVNVFEERLGLFC